MKKLLFLGALCTLVMSWESCSALSEVARAKGFVYLHEIDPTILASVRYATSENFVGVPIQGYKKPVVIMTKQAAEALKKVQEMVKKDGYSLVVYDAYRPQQAVDHFVQWSKEMNNQLKKTHYYPRVDKARVFELGYVAKRSGHSRGSTIDLTLISLKETLHSVEEKERKLHDGFTIKILDDGTLDMGSSFDLFDVASHSENDLIKGLYKKRRAYLKTVMKKGGFKGYEKEWWHFILEDEPFPAGYDKHYFNFPVE